MDVTDAAPTDSARHVLIVGAGIAGIAAALRLRAVNADCRITLVDAAARFGGKIDGEMVAGCVVDGGADVCIGAKLRATHLFDALRLGDRVVTVNPRGLPSYEKRGTNLVPAATQFTDELLTFREGMRELVDVSCAALASVTVVTSSGICALSAEDGRWKTEATNGSHIADAVIIATPAASAAELLATIAPDPAKALSALEYPPTTTVTMAWHEPVMTRPLDATGYVVTDPAARVSACTWTSSKTPSHASAGTILVRGYVRGEVGGGAAAVLAEVAEVLGITARPLFTRTYEWPAGIPVYTPEHEAAVRDLTAALGSAGGLYLAGSAFHGVGIPDCIASGERAAESVATYLNSPPGNNAA